MKTKTPFIISFIIGLLAFPVAGIWAQRTRDGAKKIEFKVMVSAIPDNAKGGFALIPVTGAQIRLSLSDGQSFSLVSSDDGLALFNGMPEGKEYVAEVSAEGYVTAIYHGRIEQRPVISSEFYILKDPGVSAKDPAPFKDLGSSDVEGFVTHPGSFPLVSVPLPEACVLYPSPADSVYTKTDVHGYFRFDGIKDKAGKVCVSRENYKSVEAAVSPEDGSRWLWLRTEQDR